jgi:phage-related baseplate assembly protein
MAPEAYILAAAIDGWLRNETDEQIRTRAAKAYNQYQNCGERSANNLFATGW